MSKHILIVDDEALSVAGPKLELAKRGFVADIASTVDDARKLLATVAYDAVLLDLMLPLAALGEPKTDPPRAKHGADLFRSIREGEFAEPAGTGVEVPVFVISALGAEAQDALDECRRDFSPMDVFLKPLRSILIAETMRLALEECHA